MSQPQEYSSGILSVAIPVPLHRLYDYLPPIGCDTAVLQPGVRVSVPFGRGRRIGVLVKLSATSEVPRTRLKHALQILDDQPLLGDDLMALLRWASNYYCHPLGEVMNAALPKKLRTGASAQGHEFRWLACELPGDVDQILKRAPRQAQLLQQIVSHASGINRDTLKSLEFDPTSPLDALIKRGWVTRKEFSVDIHLPAHLEPQVPAPVLSQEQQAALAAIESRAGFQTTLLFGVTGSGKTEVYLQLMQNVLNAGDQCLVLVPEISLTPQLLSRFQRRFSVPIVVMHSALNDSERLNNWRAIHTGVARVIIGTRSAVFAPAHKLGLIVIDEEHDTSLKQQEGFRYSARDLAVVRARGLNIPVVLGTATPSFETLNNVRAQRYFMQRLTERAGDATEPDVELIDLRIEPSHQGLSTRLIETATRHLQAGNQVLFFLNRRGYAPTWYCSGCGWMADCQHCDAHMTYHQKSDSLRCHHCAALQKPPLTCPTCEAELKPVGQGTERIEELLATLFPDYPSARMDRDVVRSKQHMENFIDEVKSGAVKILIGTQMLAKGHHFPKVTLVAIVHADQGLFGIDFRSTERLAQTIVQVSGRAGRAKQKGQVLIQTSFPEHPLLQTLIHSGYEAFANDALKEREHANWPPYSHVVLLRAHSRERKKTMDFLHTAQQQMQALARTHNVELFGPVISPMARRAGKHHGQLLLQSTQRAGLSSLLRSLRHHLTETPPISGVRWSLDVDPMELF